MAARCHDQQTKGTPNKYTVGDGGMQVDVSRDSGKEWKSEGSEPMLPVTQTLEFVSNLLTASKLASSGKKRQEHADEWSHVTIQMRTDTLNISGSGTSRETQSKVDLMKPYLGQLLLT